MLGMIEDWYGFLRSDPAEIDILREKLRAGRSCGSEEFVHKAEGITGRQLRPLPAERPRKAKK
ncbi:hypothetical protein KAX17_11335 [Candidatus Bipolaricaulota bacterium]|nr:hypothetical protein [Candidatus Bipolaricaulota bacterium]